MRVVKNKRSAKRSVKKNKKNMWATRWQKSWRKAKKRALAKRNRPKLMLAFAVLIVATIGLWWYNKSRAYSPGYNNTNSSSSSSVPHSKRSDSSAKRHDAVFYQNSAPKAKNSRTQNYSSAYD